MDSPPWFTVSGIELAGHRELRALRDREGSPVGTGSYVWNPPGDPWPVALYASDVSGICSSGATAGTACSTALRAAGHHGLAAVPESGELVVQRRHAIAGAHGRKLRNRPQRHQRCRGGEYASRRLCSVDNDPVGVSFRTPNDANPSVWVNHAVTVDATADRRPFRRRRHELQRR